MPTKVCTLCRKEKPTSEFHVRRASRDGLGPQCKPCKIAYVGERQGGAKRRAYARQYYRAHREEIREKARLYYSEHLKECAERSAKYRASDPDRIRVRNRNRWSMRRSRTVEFVSPLVLLEIHDGTCGICGEDVDPADIHIDHVIPLSQGGWHGYDNTQPTHPTCNLRKGDAA